MEEITTTGAGVSGLDPLAEGFYYLADINTVVHAVTTNFFIIIAVLLSVYPFLYIFRNLIRFAEKAFSTEAVKRMEGGGIWSRLPDASLYSGLDKIANVKVFDKFFRGRK